MGPQGGDGRRRGRPGGGSGRGSGLPPGLGRGGSGPDPAGRRGRPRGGGRRQRAPVGGPRRAVPPSSLRGPLEPPRRLPGPGWVETGRAPPLRDRIAKRGAGCATALREECFVPPALWVRAAGRRSLTLHFAPALRRAGCAAAGLRERQDSPPRSPGGAGAPGGKRGRPRPSTLSPRALGSPTFLPFKGVGRASGAALDVSPGTSELGREDGGGWRSRSPLAGAH